jgi:hypothetical protein
LRTGREGEAAENVKGKKNAGKAKNNTKQVVSKSTRAQTNNHTKAHNKGKDCIKTQDEAQIQNQGKGRGRGEGEGEGGEVWQGGGR